jgi:mannose-1-phosphate guanylyltransferase
MLSYFKEYQPKMYEGLTSIMKADGTNDAEKVITKEYHDFDKDSVEFGIFVKLPEDKSATIPADFGWEDAGTWELFYKAMRVNQNQNVIEGEAYTQFIESGSNLVIGPKGKAIGIIGLDNIAVIDTPDGLLVSALPRSGETKALFGVLEKDKPEFVE